jgi:hypothetical protein
MLVPWSRAELEPGSGQEILDGRQDGIGLAQQPVPALVGRLSCFGCVPTGAGVQSPRRAAHRVLPSLAGACRDNPTADNGSATQSKNVSVIKIRQMGIMSIFLDSSLTLYPARAVGDTLSPDPVSLLVAVLAAVGMNVPNVPKVP